jgi:hypothetical protein
MTGQRFYPVFTIAKSLSAKTKPDSSVDNYIIWSLIFISVSGECAPEIRQRQNQISRWQMADGS